MHHMPEPPIPKVPDMHHLQFLVFELALQLLGLSNLADRLVEVILTDRVSLVLDG